ncbi:2-amino-3-carboxymuconate-6-semialdehyde decarboxylase [Xylaria sp. FL0933]|nr:2-amino-3-carboxymuconate-6-semialdehyde decarboxylase [Xylaria sp. FL0933]
MFQRIAEVASRLWFQRPNTSRIDTHYTKALNEAGGDPSGWSIPSWTLEQCVRFCDTIGASFSVLSITSPGPAILGPTENGRTLARTLNEEVWEVCQQRPGKFGYFASLPDFNDIEGTIAEIKNIFEVEKHANGVVVMTSYGDKLVGDLAFRPIWEELNKYSALVFVHPGHMDMTPEKIGGFLPQPVIDYPLATTRAAMSLLVSGIMSECIQLEVILSHAGGAFPMLAQRGIGSLAIPAVNQQSKVDFSQAQSAASRFWYDLALSMGEAQLKALLATAPSSQILYGSDFPYAPAASIYGGLLQYSKFAHGTEVRKIGPTQLHDNALRLLKKHAPEQGYLPQGEDYQKTSEPEFGLEDSDDARRARQRLDSR